MKLDVRHLSFSYGDSPVLNGISFSLDKGEVAGVIGPNGCGKTTLIKCINRILVPSGTITFGGLDTSTLDPVAIARVMAYVPQAFSMGTAMTVFESVLMGRRPFIRWGVSDRDLALVSRELEILGISHLAFRSVNRISGGERQKAMLARALVQDPSLLLLDEPTSALDPRHQLEVMALIRSVISVRDTSVLMAIHDLNLAARYCTRILVLNGGRIVADGTPADTLTEENIRRVYRIRAKVRHEDGHPLIIPVEAVRGEPE